MRARKKKHGAERIAACSALLIEDMTALRADPHNFVPIILFFFSIFMFKDEFRKQGIIKRYIFRSLKLTYLDKNPRMNNR